VYGEMVIACGHLVSLENTMDIAHIFFVHAFGSKVTSRAAPMLPCSATWQFEACFAWQAVVRHPASTLQCRHRGECQQLWSACTAKLLDCAVMLDCVQAQKDATVRDLEVHTGPYGITASFTLTNQPVNPLFNPIKVSAHACSSKYHVQALDLVTVHNQQFSDAVKGLFWQCLHGFNPAAARGLQVQEVKVELEVFLPSSSVITFTLSEPATSVWA
jgi:hypothetical protein